MMLPRKCVTEYHCKSRSVCNLEGLMTSKSRCTVYFLTYVATLSARRHLDSEYQSFSFRICQLWPRSPAAASRGPCLVTSTGVTAFWASPRFGHPHSHIPSVLGIPFSHYCSVFGHPSVPSRDAQIPSVLGIPSKTIWDFAGKSKTF